MAPESSEEPMRTLEAAAGWLEGLIDVEKRPDWSYDRFSLAPIEALLERLGHPERAPRVIHVAGSKGKGSTALLAESILREAGCRVGTFTSPHLERWTERFRVDGRELLGERLVAAVDRVRPHVEAQRSKGLDAPTFFDATTAVAWCAFEEAGVDYAVMEVGLGGRLDSTNAVSPAVTCITSIELEHTDRLGTTLAAIAGEKAGILKPRVPLVVGELPAEAEAVIEARAVELEVPVARLFGEISLRVESRGLAGARVAIDDGPLEVRAELPLLGAHQPHNAALAVACARRALDGDPRRLAVASRRALERASLPGRIEVLGRSPWVIVDSAHTAASSHSLAGVLRALGGGAHLVLSISSDKNADALLEALLPEAARVTLTRAQPRRSLEPAQIARAIRHTAPGLPVAVVPNPHLALRAAAADLARGGVLCATGSVYLAGIARRVLRDPAPERVAVTRRGTSFARG